MTSSTIINKASPLDATMNPLLVKKWYDGTYYNRMAYMEVTPWRNDDVAHHLNIDRQAENMDVFCV